MTPLQKLPENVRDLGKLIVAKGFKKLPTVQKIAQSGHIAGMFPILCYPPTSVTRFANILKALVKFVKVYLVFGKILKQLRQIIYAIGVNGQILNKYQAIWSNCPPIVS